MKIRRFERDEILFLALLALVATALEYRFGLGNQTEALPLVLRALDASLFENDFYVRSSEPFGPRFYYVWIVAGLAKLLSLPAALLVLTLGVNAALAVVTCRAARDLLHADRLGGYLAAALALSVESFPLGLVTDIRFQDLQPGSLAIPFGLASLWMGLRGRPLPAAVLAALGCIPHPLYGLETGALALGAAGAVALLRPARSVAERLRALLPCVAGGALLGVAAFLLWGLPWIGANTERLPDADFIAVLTFRSPHHYLPSVFPAAHFVLAAAFLGASAITLWHWVRATGDARFALAFVAPTLAVGLLCMGGVLFVLLWPSRLWVTAQPFRLLYLVKWQGFLLLGWLVSRWIGEAGISRSLLAWTVYFAHGAAQPLVAFGTTIAERIDAFARRLQPTFPVWLLPGLALLASVGLHAVLGKSREALALVVACFLALCLGGGDTRHRGIAVALVAALVLFVGWNRSAGWTSHAALRPVYSFADQRGDDALVARWARDHSGKDALFHVPPDLGIFRLVALRAVVVDFKALPFSDAALREWRKRMGFAYGDAPDGGFPALARMTGQHRAVDDAHLGAIAQRYDANYAVLFTETPTDRPVLYANATYKIVEL